MGEACFSVPTLALLTPIAAAVVTAIVAQWRAAEKSHEREISACNQLLAEANERLSRGIPAMDQAETVLRGQTRTGKKRS